MNKVLNFDALADRFLDVLCDETEAKLIKINLTDYMIECSDGVMQLDLTIGDKTSQFVINRNSASQKIWYSSPVSKPKYYEYNDFNGSVLFVESVLKTELVNDFTKDLKIIINILDL